MKNVRNLLLVFLLSVILSACGSSGVKIPDVKGVEEDTAETLLASKSLIPRIKYVYDNKTPEGSVVGTKPAIGNEVQVDAAVTILVSKGPAYIEALDSSISWTHISYSGDDWNFYAPYIEKGTLIIECQPKFGVAMSWQDSYDNGAGFGRASISDTFDKTVPVEVVYSKKSWSSKVRQEITLRIPLADLDVKQPTTLYLELYGKVGGSDEDIKIDFSISWP